MRNAPAVQGRRSEVGTVHLRRKFGIRNSEFGEFVLRSEVEKRSEVGGRNSENLLLQRGDSRSVISDTK